MGKATLNNKEIFPSDDVLQPILGSASKLWIKFHEMVETKYPELEKEWRYYHDGKSWLMKITFKKKTIIWLSVDNNSFRTTFYLSKKDSDLVEELDIPEDLKEQYRKNEKMTKGITITYSKAIDVEYAKKLISLKMKLK